MKIFHFERRHENLAPPAHFLLRLLKNFLVAGVLVAATVSFGAWGFVFFENLPIEDSIHNSVKILSGMDPIFSSDNFSFAAKCFEVVFHLFASLSVVVATSIFLAPLLHRIMHRFHRDETSAG